MKTINETKYQFTLPTGFTLTFSDKPTADWLQGLIDGNAEATRLLRRAKHELPVHDPLIYEIENFLADSKY